MLLRDHSRISREAPHSLNKISRGGSEVCHELNRLHIAIPSKIQNGHESPTAACRIHNAAGPTGVSHSSHDPEAGLQLPLQLVALRALRAARLRLPLLLHAPGAPARPEAPLGHLAPALRERQRGVDVRDEQLLARRDVALREQRDARERGALVEVPRGGVRRARVVQVRVQHVQPAVRLEVCGRSQRSGASRSTGKDAY